MSEAHAEVATAPAERRADPLYLGLDRRAAPKLGPAAASPDPMVIVWAFAHEGVSAFGRERGARAPCVRL